MATPSELSTIINAITDTNLDVSTQITLFHQIDKTLPLPGECAELNQNKLAELYDKINDFALIVHSYSTPGTLYNLSQALKVHSSKSEKYAAILTKTTAEAAFYFTPSQLNSDFFQKLVLNAAKANNSPVHIFILQCYKTFPQKFEEYTANYVSQIFKANKNSKLLLDAIISLLRIEDKSFARPLNSAIKKQLPKYAKTEMLQMVEEKQYVAYAEQIVPLLQEALANADNNKITTKLKRFINLFQKAAQNATVEQNSKKDNPMQRS